MQDVVEEGGYVHRNSLLLRSSSANNYITSLMENIYKKLPISLLRNSIIESLMIT